MFKTISFTKRYVIALSFIALLSALAYYNLNHLISSQSNNGEIINLSSKQGMLSQQIALHAIYYKTEHLKENIVRMESAHEKLLAFPMTSDLKAIYFEEPHLLDTNVRKYLLHAKRFEENRDGRSLTYILQNSQKLLEDLDLATAVYVKAMDSNTKTLQQVELFIFLFTLTTLVFEAFFIFKPANKQIIDDTKEIVKQKEYSNLVIESNTNAIITLDSHLCIKTYNHMAEIIFGYEKEEILNKSFFNVLVLNHSFFDNNQSDITLQTIKKLDNKEETREVEAVHKNGHLFPARLSLAISGKEDEAVVIISLQDISKEKLKDKIMMEQAKFAVLGEMIAIIAHQWRQPLAQLNFNCMYIRNKLTDLELVKETEKNEEIIQFMSETITNFENFYRHTESSFFSPRDTIVKALKLLESSINMHKITMILDLECSHKTYGNSNSLIQVILSIIQNSIDAIKNNFVENAAISVSLMCEKHNVVISIVDNAGGIKTLPIDDIFKPFYSNKAKPSTGIGLYMSKMIIENQFHGAIFAQNAKDGACFMIRLPLINT